MNEHSIFYISTSIISALFDIEQLALFLLIVESGQGDLNFGSLFMDAS